ncbi:MAG: RluA family pseudouridine synthase [Fastidiosipilaceae bacterium]
MSKKLITPDQPFQYHYADHKPPISIIYLDNHIVAAIKPPGILSQADRTGAPDMLTILKGFLKNYYNKPGQVFLGLVHRLDRPVGGVMIFARTSKAASRLSAQIRERQITKSYCAIVHGRAEKTAGKWKDAIHRDRSTKISSTEDKDEWNRLPKSIVNNNSGKGRTDKNKIAKIAELSYRVIKYHDDTNLSLMTIDLHSGRTHQIRVQAASRNLPIYGDRKYGIRGDKGDIALWAMSYGFKHPTKDEFITLTAELPKSYPWSLFQ